MIAFLLNVVNQLRISPELFRIGIAQFSGEYRKEFYLNEYENEEKVKLAIRQIQQMRGDKNIGKGLHNVMEFFVETKGSRRWNGVPQNLVLITDGVSSDDVKRAADELRSLNINVFVIGIGDVSMSQLTYIARSLDKVFRVQNFNYLNLITATFVDALCNSEQSDFPGE